MKKSHLAIIGLTLLAFGISAYHYPQLPEKMATHWNAAGDVNGYMTRFWGAYLLPFFMAGITLLFMLIPVIDPLKKNIQKFRKHFDIFIVLITLFMLTIHLQVILWNLGRPVSPNLTMPIGVGLLFYYLGILCEHAKRNWFIGIRTPWTLSSDKVWKKTHQLGAKLFKASGIIALIGAFFGEKAVWFIMIPALFTAVYTIVYSYVEYQKEGK